MNERIVTFLIVWAAFFLFLQGIIRIVRLVCVRRDIRQAWHNLGCICRMDDRVFFVRPDCPAPHVDRQRGTWIKQFSWWRVF